MDTVEGRARVPAVAGAAPNAAGTPALAHGGERVAAFDLARGIAVLGMILIHVLRHWGEVGTWSSPYGQLVAFAGGPLAAPVFMVLMGASLGWSRRTGVAALAGRGLALLAGGYLLNLARGPLALAFGQATGLVGPEGVGGFTAWNLLVMVDILQVAGASLVAIALLRPVLRRDAAWLAAAAAVLCAAPLVRGTTTGIPVADGALGVLWQTGPSVFYPFFPWGAWALVGVALGRSVRRDGPGRALRRWGLAGIASAAVGAVLVVREAPVLDAPVYWELAPWLAPGILGIVLVWLAACQALAGTAVGRSAPARLLAGWSRRVTRIYVVHWLIVAWGIGLVGYATLPLVPVLGLTIVTVAAVHVLCTVRWRDRAAAAVLVLRPRPAA